MNTLEVITRSKEDTMNFASKLATYISPGDIITLEGDLGVGKTTFTKGLAIGLEIERNITSPTFTIIKEYNGIMPLYHMDAYRLEFSDEDIGFDEYFYGQGVTVVEWAKFIEDFLPAKRLNISMEIKNETSRKIVCIADDTHYETILEQLKNTMEK